MIVDLVHRFYRDLWNRWDDAAVDAILAPDFQFRGSLGQSVSGRDGWRGYRDMIRAGSDDFHNDIVQIIADGQRAAARIEYSGTHTGPLLRFEATGRRFSYVGVAFFTASPGSTSQLSDTWILGDIAGLTQQLR